MSEYSILSQIPVVLDEVQGYPLADLLAMKEHANKCGNEATNQQEKVMWNKRMTFISSEIDRRYRNVDKISDFVSGFGYDYTTFIKEEKIMSDKVEEEISHDQLRDVKGSQADDLRGFDVDVPEIPHYPDVDVNDLKAIAAEIKRLTAPVDMLLFCPKCFEQHVDEADPERCQDCGRISIEHFGAVNVFADPVECKGFNPWLNPPHKSHRCTECNHVWRPADVPTNGVQKLDTSGRADGSARPVAFANGKDFDDSVATATKRLTDENARLREGLEHLHDKINGNVELSYRLGVRTVQFVRELRKRGVFV